uniref:Uncharacterized protein n=1 Tax=Moniliophthora roreri TaxID=221103 RepID=A0A0W0GDW0_MONRR
MSSTTNNSTAMPSEGTEHHNQGTQDAKQKRANSEDESDLKIVKKAQEWLFEGDNITTPINKAKGRASGKEKAKQQDDGDTDCYATCAATSSSTTLTK